MPCRRRLRTLLLCVSIGGACSGYLGRGSWSCGRARARPAISRAPPSHEEEWIGTSKAGTAPATEEEWLGAPPPGREAVPPAVPPAVPLARWSRRVIATRENRARRKLVRQQRRRMEDVVSEPVSMRSADELRRSRSTELARERSQRDRQLVAAGLPRARLEAVYRTVPRLRALPRDVLRERLNALKDALPRAAARSVVAGAPQLLLHDTPTTIRPKLRALADATGLPAERAAAFAPSLLLLNHSALGARFDALAEALMPRGIDARALLSRAPRLLAASPPALAASLAELDVALPPELPAALLVQRQPSLLASNMSRTVVPKLRRLQELTTDAEWAELCARRNATLARALTSSMAVIERLEVLRDADAGGRGVAAVCALLKMSSAKFDEACRDKRGLAAALGATQTRAPPVRRRRPSAPPDIIS